MTRKRSYRKRKTRPDRSHVRELAAYTAGLNHEAYKLHSFSDWFASDLWFDSGGDRALEWTKECLSEIESYVRDIRSVVEAEEARLKGD